MAVSFFRLRLALARNSAKVRTRVDVFRLWGYVLAWLVAAALALLPLWLGADRKFAIADFDATLASFGLGITAISVFFAPGRVLDAAQFRQFSFTPVHLVKNLLVSSLISWTSLLIFAWGVAYVVLRSRDVLSALIASLALLLFWFTLLCVAQLAAQLSQMAFTSPRSQQLRQLLGWIIAISAAPLSIFLFTSGGIVGARAVLTEMGGALEWSPLGSTLSATDTFVSSGALLGSTKLVVSAVFLVALTWLNIFLVRRVLRTTPKPALTPIQDVNLGWFTRFTSTKTGVISARSVIYWMRDPRYRLSFAIVPVVVLLVLLATWVSGAPATVIWATPLAIICFFLGWSLHNDVAVDSTAIWLHVAAGTRGIDDRRGRAIPVLFAGIPVIIIGATLSVALMGDWRPLPAVIGMSASLLLTGVGVASYASARWPYPTTRPGDTLFIQPQFSGFSPVRSQAASVLITVGLSLPALVLGFAGIGLASLPLQLASLVIGVVGGLAVLHYGFTLGAAAYDADGADLVALSQIFD